MSDVSGSGDENPSLGVGEGDAARDVRGVDVWDHLETVVDETVTGSFRTSIGTTPCRALSGKDTNPLIAELLVSTEEVTDLATTSALEEYSGQSFICDG